MRQKLISDAEIITMLEQNNLLAWEYLYDNYAPIMYGAILRVTDNEKLAEEILIQSFVHFKANKTLSETKKTLSVSLLHHTYLTATKILSINGIMPKRENTYKVIFPILDCLLHKPNSIKDITEMYAISAEEARLRLRSELNKIRNEKLLKDKLSEGKFSA